MLYLLMPLFILQQKFNSCKGINLLASLQLCMISISRHHRVVLLIYPKRKSRVQSLKMIEKQFKTSRYLTSLLAEIGRVSSFLWRHLLLSAVYQVRHQYISSMRYQACSCLLFLLGRQRYMVTGARHYQPFLFVYLEKVLGCNL